MITLSPSEPLASRQRSQPAFLSALPRWIDALAAHWMRQAAMRALRELDDRSLRDIGIRREQIGPSVRASSRETLDRFRSQW